MLAVNRAVADRQLGFWIVQKAPHVVVQRPLVALQCHDVVALLINHLLGDLALAIECVDGHDAALEAEHLQQFGYRRDLIRLGVSGDLAQHQPLLATPGGDHMQRRRAAGLIKRAAQHLAVDRHHPLAGFGEAGHETLETGSELLGVEQAE